ncbi:DUF2169 domain-containing protein [Desulfogranum mediterraneum]|uniref:DUF2169 domain-containing protein n=1 Tax=Desulfogranum mediterraneum TaxID=160661 RepID=UPI0004156846|nr:DUF2169 domain-containing protein [Desulfogranum mediterraneum]
MKIYKPNSYGFALKSFGLGGKTYLTSTIQVFFDLTSPETILGEQELWQTLPAQLGTATLADLGFPKPHGEVLVTGSCFAPGREAVSASEVELRLGELRKRLLVFGNRSWQPGNIPSHPHSFVELPLSWNNSFGGPGYERNPLGKGYPPAGGAGQPQVLPNIEDGAALVGSPRDRPEPACFAPLDLSWPQRFAKCGTYGGNWLEERWPWFPDDFNPEFFNTAPADQYISGFFQGNEPLELINMHPDLPLIQSHLPGQRPRCFLTRRKTLSPDGESEFIELHHQLDTVWLFPTVLRGLLLYRGTLEVLDDEYADIERIYVAAEQLDGEAHSIEHYWQEQKRFWDRSVDIDLAPLEKARTKVSTMLKKMRRLPKEVEQAKLKAMGKAPRMQRTPAELAAAAQKNIANSHGLLDDQEAMARRMHGQYGHLVEIDLGMFHRMRQTLNRVHSRIDTVLAKAAQAQEQGAAVQAELSKTIRARIPAAELDKARIDPDDLLPGKKKNPWHDHGFPLVIRWRKNLEAAEEQQRQLAALGFSRQTIEQGWLGLKEQPSAEEMAAWDEEEQTVELPPGWVIPRFFEATLISVAIRAELRSGRQELLIPGSQAPPLFLPALEEKAPLIIVPDELEARLVEQELGDCCAVLALGAPSSQADPVAREALENAPQLLVVLAEEEIGTEAGWAPWLEFAPHARAVPLPPGQDLYDLHRESGLRPWLMAQLPEGFAAAHHVELSLPETGKIPRGSVLEGLVLPKVDTKAMVRQFSSELKQFHQADIAALEAGNDALQDKAKTALLAAGRDPALLHRQQPSPTTPARKGEEIAAKLLHQADRLKGQGSLSPGVEEQLKESASQARAMGAAGEQRYQAGIERLAAAKEQLAQVKAGALPEKIREPLAARGIDSERLKKLSRAEVQARCQQGLGLADTNISGLDLSGMDLSGVDLSHALCRKTSFKKCRLQGALFEQTIAQEADFSEADLSNCTMNKALMNRARFSRTRLDTSSISQSLFKGAVCSGASFCQTAISMSIFQKADLAGSCFERATIEMSLFSDAKATEASFAGAQLKKCLFKKTVLDRVDFSGASFPATLFHGAQGVEVCFRGADLSRGRMAGAAQFPGADFSGITMEQGSFLDSNLRETDFSGASIHSSLMERCDFSQAQLPAISAQETRFKGSNFEQANLRGSNLYASSFKKARLVEADLSGSNLFAADFFKCTTGKTDFTGSNLKRTLLHQRTEFLK